MYPTKNLAYASDIRGGILGAFDLETGKKVYALSLLNGYGYSREWYTRRGNRIFVASLQAMVDPHESMPEFSTLEICQLNEPETIDDFGFLSSAHDQTLLMMGRPNRPAGLTTRTVTISASAIGSFSSLPTPGI